MRSVNNKVLFYAILFFTLIFGFQNCIVPDTDSGQKKIQPRLPDDDSTPVAPIVSGNGDAEEGSDCSISPPAGIYYAIKKDSNCPSELHITGQRPILNLTLYEGCNETGVTVQSSLLFSNHNSTVVTLGNITYEKLAEAPSTSDPNRMNIIKSCRENTGQRTFDAIIRKNQIGDTAIQIFAGQEAEDCQMIITIDQQLPVNASKELGVFNFSGQDLELTIDQLNGEIEGFIEGINFSKTLYCK